MYFIVPVVVAAYFHLSNPVYKRERAWDIHNDFGLAIFVITLLSFYFLDNIAPNFYEYLSGRPRGARKSLLFWSFGYILVMFPHVIGHKFRGAETPAPEQLRGTGWYKIGGALILIYCTTMAVRLELS
jgi:hypothetical protein